MTSGRNKGHPSVVHTVLTFISSSTRATLSKGLTLLYNFHHCQLRSWRYLRKLRWMTNRAILAKETFLGLHQIPGEKQRRGRTAIQLLLLLTFDLATSWSSYGWRNLWSRTVTKPQFCPDAHHAFLPSYPRHRLWRRPRRGGGGGRDGQNKDCQIWQILTPWSIFATANIFRAKSCRILTGLKRRPCEIADLIQKRFAFFF